MSKNWQRARTTRLYIQPPKSERFYTLWREGKICFGENDNPITDYLAQTSSAIWFVDGDGEQLDFRSAEYVMQPDGLPIRGIPPSRINSALYFVPGWRESCFSILPIIMASTRPSWITGWRFRQHGSRTVPHSGTVNACSRPAVICTLPWMRIPDLLLRNLTLHPGKAGK